MAAAACVGVDLPTGDAIPPHDGAEEAYGPYYALEVAERGAAAGGGMGEEEIRAAVQAARDVCEQGKFAKEKKSAIEKHEATTEDK